MENINNFINNIDSIKGSIIAIVYTFEGENAKGFTHYDVWRSDVICDWVRAVEEIGCKPYLLDVRTFIQKAMYDTLPHIDYVVNLNAGNMNLDNLGLIPSVCSFIDIPCIPCTSRVCSVGEDKVFSNMIAQTSNIKVPAEHPENIEGGIIRHRSYGSSIGIRKTSIDTKCSTTEISQKFISGIDVTIPILYNPCTCDLETLPPIAYITQNTDGSWFLNSEEKQKHTNYKKTRIHISDEAAVAFINLAKKFDITTYCRFDTRVENFDFKNPSTVVSLENINFIEINPTPTIHNTINFATSISSLMIKDVHYNSFMHYNKHLSNPSITGYILMCSIQALKAMRSQ